MRRPFRCCLISIRASAKSTKVNRDESRCVASFNADENQMLGLCAGFIHELPNVCGRVNDGLSNV
jgi:hypothetical protein